MYDATAAEALRLSRREREVFDWLAAGLTTDDVAEQMALSAHTVRTHVKNGMRKLDATTRTHAAAKVTRLSTFEERHQCVVCGCTEDNACTHEDLGSCAWVKPALCTACVSNAQGWEHPFLISSEELVAV